MSQKRCSKCKETKEIDNFHWSQKHKNKRCTQCKKCRAIASKKYRAKYKQKRALYDKKYYRSNRERYRVWSHKRRAKLNKCKENFSYEQIKDLMKFQYGICFYCLTDIRYDYHIDHLFPFSIVSDNSINNIVLSCPKCNLSKGDKLPMEFTETLTKN